MARLLSLWSALAVVLVPWALADVALWPSEHSEIGKSSRKLMQVNIGASNNVANVTIGAYVPSGGSSSSQCSYSGLPGNSGQVPGPLVFKVPQGVEQVVYISNLGNNAAVWLYNQTSDVTLTTYYSLNAGLIAVDFKANGSSYLGQVSYLTGGRIEQYNPNDTNHNSASPASCQVNITFNVVSSTSPPPPNTPAPTQTPSPTPTPTPAPTQNNNNNNNCCNGNCCNGQCCNNCCNNNCCNGGCCNNDNGISVNVPGVNVNVGGVGGLVGGILGSVFG